MKKCLIMVLIVIAGLSANTLFSCTIFNASKNGKVLAGNNEDWLSTDSKIWFIPPSKGKYGVFYVGFETYGKQGAMNDQGLFFDANALKYSKMNPHPEKLAPPKDQDFLEMLMKECATVEEVIQLLNKYNLEGFDNGQVMFADRRGASAVVGADKNGELAITRKKGNYQVSTNFNLANPEFGSYSYPCPRYNIANEMLEKMKELSVDYFRSILAAVHSEGGSSTVYSNICDLTSGDIYVYNFHNFEEVAKFHIEEELKKGEHSFLLSSLFPRKTNAQIRFEQSLREMLATILFKTVEEKGVKSAIKKFQELRDEHSQLPQQLDRLAYLLFIRGKVEEAIEIYKFWTKEFPRSFQAYKSLGDIYTKKGDNKQATENYKKALKLNPENAEVIELLDKIQKK